MNPGYIWAKIVKYCNRPALKGCDIDKLAKVGPGSNCINVIMKRYSYMGMNNSVSNTDIGAFCSIANYCLIGGGKHSIDSVSTSPVFHGGRNIFGVNFSKTIRPEARRVHIGNDVWIGQMVFIKEGVSIGDGAIIGAHTVVTNDIPPYAIVVGNPGRVIRYRFPDETVKRLLEMKWWEMSESEIRRICDMFFSIEEFLSKQGEREYENCSCR